MAASKREVKKVQYNDCFTDDEMENLIDNEINIENDKISDESPRTHLQGDGKINNVTFQTPPNRIDLWKNTLVNYFSPEKTTMLKNGSVIKIICDIDTVQNCTIKVNFYKTGVVLIQGAKCAKFCERYFDTIKKEVHKCVITHSSPDTLSDILIPLRVKIQPILNPAVKR